MRITYHFPMLLLLSLLVGCADSGGGWVRKSTVAFAALDASVPVVNVMVGGKPAQFILDTGAGIDGGDA